MSKPPALTTTFTPSPSCLSYQYMTSRTINYASTGAPDYGPNLVANLGPVTDYSTCFPSGWATSVISYFSPGICPSGYTSACSTLYSESLGPTTSGETTVICCPSGYTCGTYPPPWMCTSSYNGDPQTTLDLYTTGSKSGSYTPAFGGVNALSVQIRYQATDFVSTTTGKSHATGLVAVAQSPGLSTGARAGIGVGITIGVLALLLLGALLLRRRRRKPEADQAPVADEMPHGIDTKQELDGAFYATPIVKDPSPQVTELDASEPHSDLTPSQPVTTLRDPITAHSFAATRAELHTQVNPTSTEPSPLAAPRARLGDAVELPSSAASNDGKLGVVCPQELADTAPETLSAVPAPREAKLGDVEGKHDIEQQIKRIREEKARLTRINELERLEAELQQRLTAQETNVD